MSLKHYKDLNPQAKQMIRGVHNYMVKEATEGVKNPSRIQKRTTEATNISAATLKRILKEAEQSETAFRTPGKIRKNPKHITGISALDKCVIRRSIHKFYVVSKKWPSLNVLLAKLRIDIKFKGSETSLRRIIKELGFVWKRNEKNIAVLIEKYQIRLARINFLDKMKQYREQKRPIVYSDELYIHTTNTNSKATEEERVVIVHAGSETGFVPNALLTFTCGSNSGDYPSGKDYDNYYNWLKNQLIPNLPPKSVLVLDNATYHNKEYDPAPNIHFKKCDMEAWLHDKGISFTSEMLKPQLYELIELNKGRYQKYSIDEILSKHGHDVLRLPPNQQDLNPLELAWVEIKSYLSTQNIDLNAEEVMDLVKKKTQSMEASEWKILCDKVKVFEEEYRQTDHIMDQLSEDLNVREDYETDSDHQDASSSDE